MATEGSYSNSSSAADSYIGSLISLTSKGEIRYEGIPHNINTEESSIGLRNDPLEQKVGEKMAHKSPQSDKVYEYILFCGSDIKDLQVKSSPPHAQTAPQVNNDPAIIQSHLPHSALASTSLPSAVSGSLADFGPHAPQMSLPGSNFHGGPPLYQPGGTMTWGASPPPSGANPTGLTMPMYWQGYYGPSNGLPQMHPQSFLHSPPGLSLPPPMQQPMQYPNLNSSLLTGALNLPEASAPLVPASSGSMSMTSTSVASVPLPSLPLAPIASEMLHTSLPNRTPVADLPATSLSSSLLSLTPPTTVTPANTTTIPLISAKPSALGGSALPYQSATQSTSSLAETSDSVQAQELAPTPVLPRITPGQILQSGPSSIAVSRPSSIPVSHPSSIPVSPPSCAPVSQPSQIEHTDVEMVQLSSSPKSLAAVAREAQPPILPVPPARTAYKGSCTVTRFTEDFDFIAMNEKFNKDEVWGHLGKSRKIHSQDRDGDANSIDEDYYDDEDDGEASKVGVKPVYNKDDFFDSLSCGALGHESHNGRTRLSEQLKIDTETFGDFPGYRGVRGGRGPGRGGRSRGGYNGGRWYHSNSGGRVRGQGRGVYSHAS